MIRQLLTTSLARTTCSGIRRPILCSRPLRPFSTTPRVHSIDNFEAFSAAFQKTTLFKKLADHPEAITAIRDTVGLLQESGIDVTSGAQPSALKMAKLMMNSRFREQVKRMAEEMNKAGIDITSKEVMDEIMALKNATEPRK